MLSRLTIRPDLKIPGLFGELLSKTFVYFALIMSRKERIRGKNIIGAIDGLLLEIEKNNHGVNS
jgi:hypothetical protein